MNSSLVTEHEKLRSLYSARRQPLQPSEPGPAANVGGGRRNEPGRRHTTAAPSAQEFAIPHPAVRRFEVNCRDAHKAPIDDGHAALA
jgi:hypothetical protein